MTCERPHLPNLVLTVRTTDLRPVEELHDEIRSLPAAERLFSEVDDEYRQMEADHAAGVASD